MRVFVTYEDERTQIDIQEGELVSDVKDSLRDIFYVVGEESRILYLSYGGADLDDSWVISDVGIMPGSTLRLGWKDEVKPVLYIHCAHSGDVVRILDDLNIPLVSVYDLRAMATRKTGIPVGAFRLVSPGGLELFDCNVLQDYSITIGDTVRLQTWDGWNDLLNLATSGFTSLVVKQFAEEELLSRYQMRVALAIAAHHGHVDLAMSLLRQDVRADEPVGDHPARQWCGDNHVDRLRAPVHIAAEMGQLGVLRTFVHHDLCYITARDGNGLMPLNIALRKGKKPCASFLLTKQLSKITYDANYSVPISIYAKMKRWVEMAKDKVLLLGGQAQSSVKTSRKPRHTAALVGQGVLLNGFKQSKMTSKSKNEMRMMEEKSKRHFPSWLQGDNDKDDPERYFKTINSTQRMQLPNLSKFGQMMARGSLQEPNQTATMNARQPGSVRLKTESLTNASFRPSNSEHTQAAESLDRSITGKLGRGVFKAKLAVDENESQAQNGFDSADAMKGEKSPDVSFGKSLLPFSKNTTNTDVPSQDTVKSKVENEKDASKMRLPPIKEKNRVKAAAPGNMNTNVSRSESHSKNIPHGEHGEKEKVSYRQATKSNDTPSGKSAFISTPKSKTLTSNSKVINASPKHKEHTNNNNDHKSSNNSTQSMSSLTTQSKKKKEPTIETAILLAKAKRGVTFIPLPEVSIETSGKPFYYTPAGKEDTNKLTLKLYERYLGETPRDYAIRCLSVATSFKEKPWLHQIRTAMTITAQGVKKIASGSPHLFGDSSTQVTPRNNYSSPEQSVS